MYIFIGSHSDSRCGVHINLTDAKKKAVEAQEQKRTDTPGEITQSTPNIKDTLYPLAIRVIVAILPRARAYYVLIFHKACSPKWVCSVQEAPMYEPVEESRVQTFIFPKFLTGVHDLRA
ncbi:predicted protein [Botrytis cinerea T4]|uniref:Uncharacterized protein n=1 Tax=Botryotinia fuckeliana (strain T4) TaxID=999810 RepID=G2XZS3_BOTF4|nr:predicted protein [Botrytis cinerea T4]